jgi:hypothetical protein
MLVASLASVIAYLRQKEELAYKSTHASSSTQKRSDFAAEPVKVPMPLWHTSFPFYDVSGITAWTAATDSLNALKNLLEALRYLLKGAAASGVQAKLSVGKTAFVRNSSKLVAANQPYCLGGSF